MAQLIKRHEANGIEVLALLEDNRTISIYYDGDLMWQGKATKEQIEGGAWAFGLGQAMANNSMRKGERA